MDTLLDIYETDEALREKRKEFEGSRMSAALVFPFDYCIITVFPDSVDQTYYRINRYFLMGSRWEVSVDQSWATSHETLTKLAELVTYFQKTM